MSRRLHLLIIDPQNDFCHPQGSLYVPGADSDMQRLATMVHRLRDQLSGIDITLDSHKRVDISHPIWWRDRRGRHPSPFTTVTAKDVAEGVWTTSQPQALERSLTYLHELQNTARYQHVVWPYHCLIGDEGHNVVEDLSDAVHAWEDRYLSAEFVAKGSNPWTEHFSAVRAEVPDVTDPHTQLNAKLMHRLRQADVILVAGQARSHCVANTVRDIVSTDGDAKLAARIVLLTDAMSDVPDPPNTTAFYDLGRNFVRDMRKLGVRTATTTQFA
jgi:nicotinamidase/pyrazinamidase